MAVHGQVARLGVEGYGADGGEITGLRVDAKAGHLADAAAANVQKLAPRIDRHGGRSAGNGDRIERVKLAGLRIQVEAADAIVALQGDIELGWHGVASG